jgi:hypothetical protein
MLIPTYDGAREMCESRHRRQQSAAFAHAGRIFGLATNLRYQMVAARAAGICETGYANRVWRLLMSMAAVATVFRRPMTTRQGRKLSKIFLTTAVHQCDHVWNVPVGR